MLGYDRGMSDEGRRRVNIELKARYPDYERALRVCRRLGALDQGIEAQTDTYFSTGLQRMKLRESSFGNHWMIWYSRPDVPGAKKSSYRKLRIPDPTAKRRILSHAMGVKVVVEKARHLFLLGSVRIHLDEVKGLGRFLEFEAVVGPDLTETEGHDRIRDLRLEFGIAEEDLIQGSYSDLMLLRTPA